MGILIFSKRAFKLTRYSLFWSLHFMQYCGSGFFHHQAKIVRKTLISSVLWPFMTLSLKNDVMYLQKVISKKGGILKVTHEKNRIRCRIRIRSRKLVVLIRIRTKMSQIHNTARTDRICSLLERTGSAVVQMGRKHGFTFWNILMMWCFLPVQPA